MRGLALLAIVGVLGAPGVALAQGEVEDDRGVQGILVDLERIVTSEESAGWFLDRTQITTLYPVALQTVCRATPTARAQALARLDARVAAEDARAIFEREGMSSAAAQALSTQRQRDLLKAAVEGGADCPFWVKPEHGYSGRQTVRNRFFLTFESGGLLQLRRTEGSWTYGGGGVARLLSGYGLGRVSLMGGAEFAGGAMLKVGGGQSDFVINYFPAVPVMLRVHSVSWHYDFELAAVSLFQSSDTRFSFGTRAGFAVGLSALRTRFLLPWAGAAVAYEHYFEGHRAPQDFIRAGLRVGGVWDP